MARKKKKAGRNPQRETHSKNAQQEMKQAKASVSEAELSQSRNRPVDAIILGVEGLTSATLAFCEATSAESDKVINDARVLMRRAGEVISWGTDELGSMGIDARVTANPARRNQRGRQPGVTPSMSIRLYSTSLFAGNAEVYLIVNTDGEVMDAIMTPSNNFAPVDDAGYGTLPILELDVTAAQFRKLRTLAQRLQEIEDVRPTFRPGRGGLRPAQETREREAEAQERRAAARRTVATERRTGGDAISIPSSAGRAPRGSVGGRSQRAMGSARGPKRTESGAIPMAERSDALRSLTRTAANPLKRKLMR